MSLGADDKLEAHSPLRCYVDLAVRGRGRLAKFELHSVTLAADEDRDRENTFSFDTHFLNAQQCHGR
jgi:hypothetical protein